MLLDLLRCSSSKEAVNLIMGERPSIPSDCAALEAAPRTSGDLLEEYAKLSAAIGFANPHIGADLKVEKFKSFLRMKDWAIFSLPTVVAYMNKKSADESAAKAGWHWRPLRSKDDIKNASFGTPARRWGHEATQIQSASDYYRGPHIASDIRRSNQGLHQVTENTEAPSSGLPYDKLVPIHALRKVAEIEKSFSDPVSFFVCDYAPAPHIEHPDPFLMAVINNARLNHGVGRFVIDFWDEPGFGIDQMTA